MTSTESAADRRVFLSFAHEDLALAQRISEALARSDIPTLNHSWKDDSAEPVWLQLRETIRSSDVVVVLLSPAARTSGWVGKEIEFALSSDLDRRGVEFIPVLAAPTDLPPTLRDRAAIDLTKDFAAGLRQLVAQIEATSHADFSALSPQSFERLVADLLRAVGFRVEDVRYAPDMGVDMRAAYQRADPFGGPETELWLVQAKLYSHERVSVVAIKQFAGAVAVASGETRGLLVTNAQLTSVAREYLASLERGPQVRLRVLDGVELRRLLRQFPAVAARYFGGSGETSQERDGDS